MVEAARKAPTVGLSVYEAIRDDIIFGLLAPDAKLKLDRMKASYKVSIPTLRETLNRLASDGFVVAEEQRGFYVAPVSKADLFEVSDLRILLEGSALTRSIENGDTDWEGAVAAAHHKLHRIEQKMRAGDETQKELWKRYDWEFHQSMILACGSRNLLAMHGTIYDKYLRYQMQLLSYRGEVVTDEHGQLFEAALDRDADRAVEILRQHIEGCLQYTIEELKALSN